MHIGYGSWVHRLCGYEVSPFMHNYEYSLTLYCVAAKDEVEVLLIFSFDTVLTFQQVAGNPYLFPAQPLL